MSLACWFGNNEWNEREALLQRELSWKQSSYRIFNALGYTKYKLRWFDRSPAKIEHDGCINTAKWSNDGELLLTGSDDRLIKIWQLGMNYNKVKLAHSLETRHRGNVFCVEQSPLHNDLIVSAAADGYLRSNYIDNSHTGSPMLASEDMM
jgi:WD40 repeat protein